MLRDEERRLQTIFAKFMSLMGGDAHDDRHKTYFKCNIRVLHPAVVSLANNLVTRSQTWLGKLHKPAVVLALLVELASETIICGLPDDALLVQGGDDAVRFLVDEGDAVHVVREVDKRPLQLFPAVLLLRVS